MPLVHTEAVSYWLRLYAARNHDDLTPVRSPVRLNDCRGQPSRPGSRCENFLYVFKAARRAARAAEHGGVAGPSAGAPGRTDPNAGRLARTAKYGHGPRGSTLGVQGHGGFDKGTLAAARIGLKRACQEGARSWASV